MKTIASKLIVLTFVFAFLMGFNALVFAENPPEITTTLTDTASGDTPGAPKESIIPNTPKVYVFWKSEQLKWGQKIKSVWIADDTNKVAPDNYKIDEATFELNKDFKSKMIASLPGSYWSGVFSCSKPTAGWPVGKYHVDIYVDNVLIKSVKFSVAKVAVTETTATPTGAAVSATKHPGWDAIAIDNSANDMTPYWGTGADLDKTVAEQGALKTCTDAGGKHCQLETSYQECGAYAISKNSNGKGLGETKKIAEANAMNACKGSDCTIVVSDCNEQ